MRKGSKLSAHLLGLLAVCLPTAIQSQYASAAEPMQVLIGPKLLRSDAFKQDVGLPPQANDAAVNAALRRALCVPSPTVDCNNASNHPQLRGFSRLLRAGSNGSWNKIGATVPAQASWIAQCNNARMKKIGYHQVVSGTIPDSFGKIINWAMTANGTDAGGRPVWEGTVEVCTWIGDDEYYFKLRIAKLVVYSKTSDPNDPFPGTLPLPEDQMAKNMMLATMNNFDYKLHARGADIIILQAIKNNTNIASSDVLFLEPESNCFDLFLKAIDPGRMPKPTDPLPAQQHYCMGRCDARILNTM